MDEASFPKGLLSVAKVDELAKPLLTRVPSDFAALNKLLVRIQYVIHQHRRCAIIIYWWLVYVDALILVDRIEAPVQVV